MAGRRQPPWVPSRQRPLLWPRALRPLLPVSAARRVPSEGTRAPLPLCPPSTAPALQKRFSLCGAFSSHPDRRGLELLALCPEAGGGATRAASGASRRALSGSGGQSLQGWRWAGWGGVSSRGRRQLLFPGCPSAPHSESHPIPLPLLPQTHGHYGSALKEGEASGWTMQNEKVSLS